MKGTWPAGPRASSRQGDGSRRHRQQLSQRSRRSHSSVVEVATRGRPSTVRKVLRKTAQSSQSVPSVSPSLSLSVLSGFSVRDGKVIGRVLGSWPKGPPWDGGLGVSVSLTGSAGRQAMGQASSGQTDEQILSPRERELALRGLVPQCHRTPLPAGCALRCLAAQFDRGVGEVLPVDGRQDSVHRGTVTEHGSAHLPAGVSLAAAPPPHACVGLCPFQFPPTSSMRPGPC